MTDLFEIGLFGVSIYADFAGQNKFRNDFIFEVSNIFSNKFWYGVIKIK